MPTEFSIDKMMENFFNVVGDEIRTQNDHERLETLVEQIGCQLAQISIDFQIWSSVFTCKTMGWSFQNEPFYKL